MDISKVKYRITGEGQTILFVNMHFQKMEAWESVTNELSRYYRIINFEFPNQGTSYTDLDCKSLKDYAMFAKELLEELNEDSKDIVAVGYSFAANVLRVMNIDLGVEFKSLIIGGIYPSKLRDYYIEIIKEWDTILKNMGVEDFANTLALRILSPGFISKNPSVINVIKKKFKENYSRRIESLEAILNAPRVYYENDLINITKDRYLNPVHIIAGENDMIITKDYIEEYSKEIKSESFSVIDKCGHDILLENANGFIGIIDEIVSNYED